ncbi:trem-like transcript 4 protein isoform X2 [Trichosurus vulpecula]|uniref:trem-like transcript 4 protein isoform X2 n=1 Tax=Trichosurus vulpecula TaxID=9337 RepID=UPI00186AD405|nr:trem-like transcript 4 protein isoform X2 [Trichosurus vulpecula]
MERSKMTPEVLLQLLLLLLWVSCERGSLGKEIYEEEHRVVGETLTVSCRYTPPNPDHLDKAWCKKIENTTRCTLLITRPQSWSKTKDPRYSLSYNTSVISVNMSGLQIEDSGEYWCGNHNSSANIIDVFKKVLLTVLPAQTRRTTKQKLTTMIETITITSATIRPQLNITGTTYLMYTDVQPTENSTSRSQVVDHVGSVDLRVMGTLEKRRS